MNRVLFLLTLSVLINYIDRSNLSIAAPLIKDELGLSGSQLGTLLSAFFWTYALLQIPAGWLVDHFDVKSVFAIGFLIWSVATAITGALHGFLALLLIRVVLGVGESVAFPAYSKIVGTHFKESSRGVANAAITSGLALGPAAGMLIGGTAVGLFGWRAFFVTLGLAALFWLWPWWVWMPRRTDYSAHAVEHQAGVLAILRQRSAWGTCLGLFSFNYCSYFLVTWLPFYLVRERHLTMNQMARVGGLVFLLFSISSIVCGKLLDRWIAAGSPLNLRKTLTALGEVGLGVSLVAAALSAERIFIWMLALTGLCMGMAACNIWAITQTMAGPRMVGRWTGVQNFVGNFAGAVAPALTGFLLDRTSHFYWAFLITAAVVWTGALSWILIVGPVEEVKWEASLGGVPIIPAPDAPPPYPR